MVGQSCGQTSVRYDTYLQISVRVSTNLYVAVVNARLKGDKRCSHQVMISGEKMPPANSPGPAKASCPFVKQFSKRTPS